MIGRRDAGRLIARMDRAERAQGDAFDPQSFTRSGIVAAASWEPSPEEIAAALVNVREGVGNE